MPADRMEAIEGIACEREFSPAFITRVDRSWRQRSITCLPMPRRRRPFPQVQIRAVVAIVGCPLGADLQTFTVGSFCWFQAAIPPSMLLTLMPC